MHTPPPEHQLSPDQLEVFRRAALILTSSVDLDEALNNTIAACLPALGDFGFFDVVLQDGVRRTARAHDDPVLEQQLKTTRWHRNERPDINLCALSSGQAALHANTDDAWFAHAFPGIPRTLQFRSMLSVPVFYGAELIGSLTLFMAGLERNHCTADVYFATEISSLAAPVVVKARLMAQQRAAEVALRTSEQRFQLALRVGGMGAWQWDMLTNQVYWWPGMAELHGLPADTQLRDVKDYLLLVHPDDRELAGRSLNGELNEKTGKGIEYRVLWPDGSVHWLDGRGDIVFNEDGKPVYMSGVSVDVTQRKLTEQKLRFVAKASAELAELVEHEETLERIARLAVPDFADWCAVDLLTDTGHLKRVAVAHVDPAKTQLAHELHTKYPPDPGAPNGAWQIVRSGKPELMAEISDDTLAHSIKDPVYLKIVRDLGLRSYIGVPLITRGKTIGVLTFISAESRHIYGESDVELAEEIGRRAGVAIDNSMLYRSLQENDRRKDDFLAMLAHELRNPLAPVSAAAQLLAVHTDLGQIRRSGEVIARQVAHMTSLVDDLLDVSRVTRGHVEIEQVPVDMGAVIHAAVEQARPMMERKSQTFRLALPPGDMSVAGDQKRLVQVVSNLLNNAAKFTPPHGLIELQAELHGGELRVVVKDNGIGMSTELLDTAFELFVQGETTMDRSQGGLGLGLALVKHMVELHGGRISAQSEGPGCGSRLVMHLPALAREDSAPTATRHPGPLASGPRSRCILVVDDNVDGATMLSMLLAAAGHRTEVLHHPRTVLDRLAAGAFDALILDIGLPDIDGHELARRIRARDSASTLVIGVSGYGQESDRQSALAAGMDHYLVKPVDTDELFAILGGPAPR